MAGGGAAESVPPHDLAIIIGAVGLLGAVFIFTWAQPTAVDFDAGGGVVEVAQVKVGILGSNDELVVTWQQTEFCEEVNVTCSLQRIRVLDESGSVIVRQNSEPPVLDFSPKPHWDLGEELGIIDFERGTKLAGSRFYTMMGYGPKLERALIAWMLDLHSNDHGYTEVSLPAVVKREIMEGSGNLPKFADNLYHDDEDDLWLIPTAEVPITNLYRDEIIPANTLPLKYVAQTPCFRREKASAGRDTRGIKRVHQFNKVEMYQFVEPETSNQELEKLVDDAEDVCRKLGFTYRVLQLCTGDMGFASSKTYDIEVWAAGCEEWLEVSSCSNCTDFQARRSNIRYRAEEGGRPRLPHTLNGSGLALPRVMIAIMENYQQPDGSVVIPEVLRPYTGFDVIPAKEPA